MSKNQPMVFEDVEPIEIPVTVKGQRFVLREASGDSACKYRNALLKCTRLGSDGKPVSVEGMADVEPLLVSLCLYVGDGEGRITLLSSGLPDPRTRVSESTIRSWKASIQKALFEKVKEISDLDEKETKESLEKRLQDTQEKLSAMGDNSDGEDPTKNGMTPPNVPTKAGSA